MPADATQTTDDTDFESAFAEATAANAAASTPEVPADGDPAAAAAATPAPAPAPAPAADATADATPAPAPAPGGDATPPVELSAEELKRQVAEAIHRERSSAQRISAIARENNDLKALVQRLQAQTQQTAAAPAASAAPAAPAVPDTPDVLTEAKDLEAAVVKRAAAMVEPLKKQLEETIGRVDKATQAVDRVQEAVTPIAQKTQRETFEATWRALDEKFGQQWREDVRSEGFGGWLGAQPAQIQDLYAKAVTPEESAKVMNLFYAETGKFPTPAAAAAAPAPAPTPAANTQQQRLRLAAGIAKTGAPPRAPAGPAVDDYEANFEAATRALKQA